MKKRKSLQFFLVIVLIGMFLTFLSVFRHTFFSQKNQKSCIHAYYIPIPIANDESKRLDSAYEEIILSKNGKAVLIPQDYQSTLCNESTKLLQLQEAIMKMATANTRDMVLEDAFDYGSGIATSNKIFGLFGHALDTFSVHVSNKYDSILIEITGVRESYFEIDQEIREAQLFTTIEEYFPNSPYQVLVN